MKIVVILRTRNEEKNIAEFCRCYQMADLIIVSDGGSKDNTVEIAKTFKNVEVHNFPYMVSKDDGKTWRNPHGSHINDMIIKATEAEADWIIFDDCDCFPTVSLQENLRSILETTDKDTVFLNRVYMYGSNAYLADATLAMHRRWEDATSLYAWKPGKVYASMEDPWVHDMRLHDAHILHLSPPNGAMHDFYPDDGSRLKKVEFYDKSGEQPDCNDPLKVYKDIRPLEEWMKWR